MRIYLFCRLSGRSRGGAWRVWLGLAGALAAGAGGVARAQDAGAYFKQHCASCHTIGGGRLVGPDLQDATQRRDPAWLIGFIKAPQAVIQSGDPYARKLLEEAGGVLMPAIPGMTDEMARALVELIEAESRLETSRFKGASISERPFVPADIARGRELFVGRLRLENGGPACAGCHTLPHVGGLGGGLLAPDLTRASERLGGRKGLGAWLGSPATPTMQALFGTRPLVEEEILSLVACFQDSAQNRQAPDPARGRLGFVALGAAAAVAGLSLFARIWRRRLRGVRSALVQAAHGKVTDE